MDIHKSAEEIGPANSKRIFLIIISSTLLILLLKMCAPYWGQWDINVQILAALRLVAGNGLTVNYHIPGLDLSQNSAGNYLTHFPPGFSLLLASLLFFGLSTVSALKIIFASATLLGWIAWGKLASRSLSEPLFASAHAMPFNYALAVVLPIYFTPYWAGTDLFLWAGTPWVYLLLVRQGGFSLRSLLDAAAAGLLAGFLYSIRYASAFLVIMALLLLLVKHRRQWLHFLGYAGSFIAGSLICILPVILYTKYVNSTAMPSFFSLSKAAGALGRIITDLPSLLYIWYLPFGDHLLAMIKLHPRIQLLFGFLHLGVVAGLFCCWYFWVQRHRNDAPHPNRFLPLIPLTLIAFLLFSMFGNVFSFISIQRYYYPANLPILLLVFEIATAKRIHGFLRGIFSLTIGVYILSIFLFLPVQTTRETQRGNSRYLYMPVSSLFESNRLRTDFEDVVEKIQSLREKEPEALMMVDWAQEMVTRLDLDYMKAVPLDLFRKQEPFYRVEKAVVIYWVINTSSNPITKQLESLPGSQLIGTVNGSYTPTLPILRYWINDSFLRSYYRLYGDPDLEFRIYRTMIPAGYQFRDIQPSP